MNVPAVCLMGPTASGKTEIAVRLCKRFPFRVISVDSALVYRGMDVGTAKPDSDTLARVPHRLVDIRDPEEPYSAGDFVRDAREEIEAIRASGQVPLLVGGTMMYFRALTGGMAELPSADPDIRAEIDAQALAQGWPALYAELAGIDPETAARLNPNDSQRIQRALEVYRATGQTLTSWHEAHTPGAGQPRYIKLALMVEPRSILHERIEARLDRMFADGFLDEVRSLMARPGLDRDHPSMRAVGYRQVWTHLAGECSLEEARYRALVATRQLAKRQITWLRAERDLSVVDPLETGAVDHISRNLVAYGLNQGWTDSKLC